VRDCRNLRRTGISVHLLQRQDRLDRATSRLWHRFKTLDPLKRLVGDGIFESDWIG
jgi:hypothetical protein